jgi:uncharacterized membrane protein
VTGAGVADRASLADRAAAVARFVGLLFGGVFAGFLVTVLVLEATLRGVGASVYTQVRGVELVHLDDLATATLVPALVATAVLAVLAVRRGGRSRWLVVTALVLLLLVFATSILVNLPINHDQLGWSVQAPPADWARVRDRWQVAHLVRTAAALLAFGCLGLAAVRRSSPPGAGSRAPSPVPSGHGRPI